MSKPPKQHFFRTIPSLILLLLIPLTLCVKQVSLSLTQTKIQALDLINNDLAVSQAQALETAAMNRYMAKPDPLELLKRQSQISWAVREQQLKHSRVQYHRFLDSKFFLPMLRYGEYDWTSSIRVFIFLAGLILLVILTSLLARFIRGGVKKNVTSRLSEIAKDIFILLVLISILKIADYFRWVEDPDRAAILNDIELLLSEITIALIFVNLVVITFAQLNIRYWNMCETNVPDRLKIYRDYEKLYMEKIGGSVTRVKLQEYYRLRNLLKFIILRQEFLCQTFTPKIKESVLRDDFRFADYLGKKLFKVIKKTVSLRISTILVFILFFGFYILMRLFMHEEFELYAMLGIALGCFVLNLMIKVHSQTVFQNLSHPLNSPYEFQVSPFDAVRNPQGNRGKIYTPSYLRNHFENVVVTKKRIVNPHESLFFLSSPNFCLRIVHSMMFLQIIWTVVFYSNYLSEVDSKLDWIFFIIGNLLILFNVIVLLPITLRNLAVVTGIEMLKDKKLIFEVITEQKQRISKAYCKFYRLIKTLKREIETDFSEEEGENAYVDLIVKLTRSSFSLLDRDGDAKLGAREIGRLCELLGKKLTKEQMYYFVRRCDFKNDQSLMQTPKQDLDDTLNSDELFSEEEESEVSEDSDGESKIHRKRKIEEDSKESIVVTGKLSSGEMRSISVPKARFGPLGDSGDISPEESRSEEDGELIVSFYKYMEVLEEFNGEEKWDVHIVTAIVLQSLLRSKSPVSHYEIR